MSITRIALAYFLAMGHINNKLVIGYGRTTTEATLNAFKDYQVILNLR